MDHFFILLTLLRRDDILFTAIQVLLSLLDINLKKMIPEFSRGAAGALDLRQGPQGPALVDSGKDSPHASCSGASRDSSPVDAGPKTLCGVGAGT